MAEKMLVTQALDERDLLVDKITDKIGKAVFIDTIKPNEDKVFEERISREDFAKNAESAYQQIQDLIDRYQKIDSAIVASNAKTKVKTSYGEYTVAGAISLRNRLRGVGSYGENADFEGQLQNLPCTAPGGYQVRSLRSAGSRNGVRPLRTTSGRIRARS